MILNNMKEILNAISITGGGSAFFNEIGQILCFNSLKYTDGSSGTKMGAIINRVPLRNFCKLATSETTTEINGYCVGFGSGNTPVSATDHKLQNFIASGLSLKVTETQSFQSNDNRNTGTFTNVVAMVITNTNSSGGDSITINEVGFYEDVWYSNTAHDTVLVHREVLDAPITLVPNETKTLTFTFVFENSVV